MNKWEERRGSLCNPHPYQPVKSPQARRLMPATSSAPLFIPSAASPASHSCTFKMRLCSEPFGLQMNLVFLITAWDSRAWAVVLRASDGWTFDQDQLKIPVREIKRSHSVWNGCTENQNLCLDYMEKVNAERHNCKMLQGILSLLVYCDNKMMQFTLIFSLRCSFMFR